MCAPFGIDLANRFRSYAGMVPDKLKMQRNQ